MKIIFLGAGNASRLLPYTEDKPKWMLPLRGMPILEYLVASAHEAGITEVIIVRGSKGGEVRSPSVIYVSDHDRLNMVHSLFKAEAYLYGDVIISYADILYEVAVLDQLLNADADVSVVVDLDWETYYSARTKDPCTIAESLILDGKRIVEIGQPLRHQGTPCGQYIGLMKFSASAVKALCKVYRDLLKSHHGRPWRNAERFEKAYMTDMLQELIDRGIDVRAVPIRSGWLEFDTVSDYERVLEWDAKGVLSRFIRLDRLPKRPSVLSAGGVMIDLPREKSQVLLVGDGRPRGWRLPKGMQEPGESVEQTAIREVTEETGLEPAILKYIGRAGWTYQYHGDWWDERVHFYLMRPLRGSTAYHNGECETVRWMPLHQALHALHYDSERRVLHMAVRLIKSSQLRETEDHGRK